MGTLGDPMRTRKLLAALLMGMAGMLFAPCTMLGQAPAAWFGTWKLDLAKSVYDPGPAPYKRAVSQIEPYEDGMKITYDLIADRGQTTHVEWVGKFDGQDYVVEGVDYVLTNAYSQIDANTYQVVVKVDGQITSVSHIALSPDGKTMTTETDGENQNGQELRTTTVYEKQ